MKDKKSKNLIPRLPFLILQLFADQSYYLFASGDLEELYLDKKSHNSSLTAYLWLWKQILMSIPKFIQQSLSWGGMMLLNHMKIVFRNMYRHKIYSLINLTGLSIGMTCFILIMLFVNNEHSYDNFHKDADNIYRIAGKGSSGGSEYISTATPWVLAETLLEKYPEVESATRLWELGTLPFKHNGDMIDINKVFHGDQYVFEVFTFDMLHNNKPALVEPNTVVISEKTALLIFNDVNVVDKEIHTSDNTLKVVGVFKDLPSNSHFKCNIIISYATINAKSCGWMNLGHKTYVKLQNGVSEKDLNSTLDEIVQKYVYAGNKNLGVNDNYWMYFTQPLKDIHLNSNLAAEFEVNGNGAYVNTFMVVAFFILVIACINYINLSTAKSSLRSKEIGVKKVLGSNRKLLRNQFIFESIITCLISVLISQLLVNFLLPHFSMLMNRPLEINYFDNYFVIPIMIGFAILIGIISGLYPAFFLSNLNPVTILSGNQKIVLKKSLLRNLLVVLQFSISVFMFIGTIIVSQQLDYFQNKDLGFDKNNILIVNKTNLLNDQVEDFKNIVSTHSSIKSVSGSFQIPGGMLKSLGLLPDGAKDRITFAVLGCDKKFDKTYNIKVTAGRFFSEKFKSDESSLIINKTAQKLLGWEEPLNKKLSGIPIIGVIEDFNFSSLHKEVAPTILLTRSRNMMFTMQNHVSIKFEEGTETETIAFVKTTWDNLSNGVPFSYTFLDEYYNTQYSNEENISSVLNTFAILSVFIAALGLFGLTSFMLERKTKEIGIRKVMGASIQNIVFILSKDFLKLIIAANIIAWPIAFFFMNNWLSNFAYRIDVSFAVFFIAGINVFFFAFLIICVQSIKAGLKNPIKSLRYE